MPVREFGPWLPDIDEMNPVPHLRDANGCVPGILGYRPFPSLAATSSLEEVIGRPYGAVMARDKDGSAHIYAASATKLHEFKLPRDWQDRSKTGNYTAATSKTRWRFATFGDRLIATNGLDAPQYIDMSTASTQFDDLPGSPGICKYVATYDEFVFLGALGSSGMAIKWSALGDSEGWTAGVGLSDEQEFADGGAITGLLATKSALYVFQEKCMRRVTFVGGDVIMRIDKLFSDIGCIEPNSLVGLGQRCFFLSEDGWYMWDFEGQPIAIGNEKFDRWFLDNSERDYWYAMSCAIDPKNRLFVCAFAAAGQGSDAFLRSALFYNYEVGRASYLSSFSGVRLLLPAVGLAASIDDLTGNLDSDYGVSFDDPIYGGGGYYFGAMTTGGTLKPFNNGNLPATFELSPSALFDGQRASIEWAKPLTDSADATVAAGAKVKPSDAITFGAQVSPQASGRCPQRGANGFYHAAKVVIPSDSEWTWARGVEFKPSTARGVR
jgi:hypothetical protein